VIGRERHEMMRGTVSPEVMRRGDDMYRQAIASKRPISYTVEFQTLDGPLHFDAAVIPVLDEAGACKHVLWTARDTTEKALADARSAQQLEEKEILLREVHHRVKNNLQVVSSLLFLQRERAQSAEATESLRESSARVAAMALIHEKLYGADDLSGLDMRVYARELVLSLLSSFGVERERIELDLWGAGVILSLDQATPYALILNELVTNSLKHAFPNGRAGHIQLGFSESPDHHELTIGDDGIGAPEDVLAAVGPSLGMRLVSRLLKQLGAELERLAQPGTVYRLRMSKKAAR